MSALVLSLLAWLSPLVLLAVYVWWNDQRLLTIPPAALYFSPSRTTIEEIHSTSKRLASSPPLSNQETIPPKTSRRYIIVGGGGFLGGWIATKLLQRGEEYQNIRLLDLNPPTNHRVLLDALTKGVQYFRVDITDPVAVEAAFNAPWPTSYDHNDFDEQPELTVFHTAANIRFYERHLAFLHRSVDVNVQGTQNIINAARSAGASILIYTSSASVGLHRTRLLLWPWETEPERFVQVANDDDSRLPKQHDQFFSNYAATKMQAERLVRQADRSTLDSKFSFPPFSSAKNPVRRNSAGVMRTGCLRPGNGIFGPRGDTLFGAQLVRQFNPSWSPSVVQSFTYVENAAVAHLAYEQRLVEALSGRFPNHPDIGGQAFCVADPGPAKTWGDAFLTLQTLSEGECTFPVLSPTLILLMAIVIEWYYRGHHALRTSAVWGVSSLAHWLPTIGGDMINLQPALFSLINVHFVIDDSRARLPPAKGGLGYTGVWTTQEGLHQTYEEHRSGVGRSEIRSDGAGVSFGLMFKGKKHRTTASTSSCASSNGIGLVTDVVGESDMPIGPVEVLN